METPVRAAQDGVRFDPDKMEGERLYHCMFGGKLVLVFKDTQDFVHCYEVEDREIVEMAGSVPQGGIDEVLEAYISNTLNKKPPGPGTGQELSEPDKTKDAEEILSEFASKRQGGCCSGGHEHSNAAENSGQPTGGGGCCSGGHEHAKGGSFDVVQISSDSPRSGGSADTPDSAEQGTSTVERETEQGTSTVERETEQGAPEERNGAPEGQEGTSEEKPERNVIFVGTKPIMTYINATLQQMASYKVVTIKARGKRITQAVDVSQMIVKRMNAVGYTVSDVRISSDSLKSQDGRERNVSTIELDIARS